MSFLSRCCSNCIAFCILHSRFELREWGGVVCRRRLLGHLKSADFMSQRNKKCEACSYDLRGAKWRHVRGPDSREGRFTLVAPGVGASTRNQWTGSVLSRTLLLLGVRGRFSPPRYTHRCRATVAMEVSVPASVAQSLEPPFSDHRAAYRCSRVEIWRLLQQSSRSRDFLRSVWWNCRRNPCGSLPARRW